MDDKEKLIAKGRTAGAMRRATIAVAMLPLYILIALSAIRFCNLHVDYPLLIVGGFLWTYIIYAALVSYSKQQNRRLAQKFSGVGGVICDCHDIASCLYKKDDKGGNLIICTAQGVVMIASPIK